MTTQDDLRMKNSIRFVFPFQKGLTKKQWNSLSLSLDTNMTELLGEVALEYYSRSQRGLEAKPS